MLKHRRRFMMLMQRIIERISASGYIIQKHDGIVTFAPPEGVAIDSKVQDSIFTRLVAELDGYHNLHADVKEFFAVLTELVAHDILAAASADSKIPDDISAIVAAISSAVSGGGTGGGGTGGGDSGEDGEGGSGDISGDPANLEALCKLLMPYVLRLYTAPAEEIAADVKDVLYLEVDKAKPAAHDATEIEASKSFYIVRLLSYAVAYLVAEIAYSERMYLPHKAPALSADGAVGDPIDEIWSTPHEAPALSAPAELVDALQTILLTLLATAIDADANEINATDTFGNDSEATVDHADAEEVNGSDEFANSSSATMATWFYPYIDDDGYLVVQQAYSAAMTDDFLEVY